MLNILYTLSIEIDFTWSSSIASMEIYTNWQYTITIDLDIFPLITAFFGFNRYKSIDSITSDY